MVSILPHCCNSSSLLQALGDRSESTTTSGISSLLLFFFPSSQARSMYLTIFSLFFFFHSVVFQKGNIRNILTSDPAELSNKKCTCVNNRFQGITLTVDWLNWVQMRRSLKQVDSKQLYNPVPQEVRVSWRSEFGVSCYTSRSENQVPAEDGPSGPRFSSPGERERSTVIAMGVNMLQHCSVSNSPLTHNPFVTLSYHF